MIKLIEAQNFRSLKSISCAVAPFNVLVGSNGSGKTTFLDVLQFVSDILSEKNIEKAVKTRVEDFNHLTFAGKGGDICFAVEAIIPINLRENLWKKTMDTVRYEVCFGISKLGNISIKEERVVIFDEKQNSLKNMVSPTLFPDDKPELVSLINKKLVLQSYRQIVKKNPNNKSNYSDETSSESGKGWVQSLELDEEISAFANLYGAKDRFIVSRWFYKFLTENMQTFVLDSLELRKASPPRYRDNFSLDGSNLPWNVKNLKEKQPEQFNDWVEHVQTAIQGLKSIDAVLREDDKHCYLKLTFEGGAEIPSWLVSDGTLRLMAFTILAYLPDLEKTFLIEEPENGIHPKNMETIFQSLSHVKNSQVFLATHSPAILSLLEPKQILCFAKTESGVTDIVRGDKHPQLMHWKGEIDLSILHAGGVMG